MLVRIEHASNIVGRTITGLAVNGGEPHGCLRLGQCAGRGVLRRTYGAARSVFSSQSMPMVASSSRIGL